MKYREIPIFGSAWMYTLSSFRIAIFELSGNSEDAFFFFCLFHPTLKDSVPASAVAVLCAKNEKDENQTEMIKRKGGRRLEKKAIFDRWSVEFLSKKVLLLRIYRILLDFLSRAELAQSVAHENLRCGCSLMTMRTVAAREARVT